MYNVKLQEIILPVELLKIKSCKGFGPCSKSTKLSADDKLLYSYLKACYTESEQRGELLNLDQDHFSNVLGFSKKTVQRKIKLLVSAGLVSVVYTDRNNIYKVYDYIKKDFSEEMEDDCSQQVKVSISNVPCQFYIQEWKAPFFQCIKFGIAYDTEVRSGQQHKESMFAHKIVKVWEIPTRRLGLKLENEIKKNFPHSGCLKIWAPDGFSETVSFDDKLFVIDFIDKYLTQTT